MTYLGRHLYFNLTLNHNYVLRGPLYVSGYCAGGWDEHQFHWSIGHRLGRFLFGIGVPCNLGWHPEWAKEHGWETSDVGTS